MKRIKFGSHEIEQSYLADLVNKNIKTATSSLNYYNLKNPEQKSILGEIWEIYNGLNEFICSVKVTEVSILKFSEVDEEFAIAEGDGSFENWYTIHYDYYSEQLEKEGINFSQDIELECVYFKKIDKNNR